MSDVSDQELLHRWRQGDEFAAEQIFERYSHRMWKLAEKLIAQRLKPRFDGDDVVQSVFRTFLRHSRDGDFRLGPAESLWALLSEIARHKIRRQVAFHLMQRRSIQREQRAPSSSQHSSSNLLETVFEPSAEEALSLVEEVAEVLDKFDPRDRDVLRYCLDGHSSPQIAERLGCSRWSVRRALDAMGRALAARLREEPPM